VPPIVNAEAETGVTGTPGGVVAAVVGGFMLGLSDPPHAVRINAVQMKRPARLRVLPNVNLSLSGDIGIRFSNVGR
jgi:hypothetical protein